MSIVTERIYGERHRGLRQLPRRRRKIYLVEALGTPSTVDVGVIIVNGEARILHANQAAKRMLDH